MPRIASVVGLPVRIQLRDARGSTTWAAPASAKASSSIGALSITSAMKMSPNPIDSWPCSGMWCSLPSAATAASPNSAPMPADSRSRRPWSGADSGDGRCTTTCRSDPAMSASSSPSQRASTSPATRSTDA